jgi:hypothetical protein
MRRDQIDHHPAGAADEHGVEEDVAVAEVVASISVADVQPTVLDTESDAVATASTPSDAEMLKAWRERDPGMWPVDSDIDTWLFIAADNGDMAVVATLLAGGAGVHMRYRGMTPLHAAAANGHAAVVAALLEAGAKVDAAGDRRKTRWIGKTRWIDTPLHVAATKGHEAVVAVLLAGGAVEDAADDGRGSALHLAAMYGHEAAVRVLIGTGTDVKAEYDAAL